MKRNAQKASHCLAPFLRQYKQMRNPQMQLQVLALLWVSV